MRRIGLGLIAAAILVLIASIVSVYALNAVIRDRELLTDHLTRNLLIVERMQLATERRIASSRAFLVTGDKDFLTTVKEQEERFALLEAELRSQLPSDSPESQLLAQISDRQREHRKATARIQEMKESGQRASSDIARVFENEVYPKTQLLKALLGELMQHLASLQDSQRVRAKVAGARFQKLVLVISITTFILATVVLTLALRSIAERNRAARASQELLERLREALRIRDEFISIASHELRTPITSLKLQMGLLGRRVEAEQDPARKVGFKKPLEVFARQVERLNQLVENMLDITNISSFKMPLYLEEFDLGEAIHAVSERLEGVLRASGSSLSVNLSDELRGIWDRSRLEQVLENVINNAAKYGRGNPIEVRAYSESGGITIEVQDHGIGVAADDQSRIFDRFERAIPASNISGLGLGLYISRHIVESHGGRITITSKPDQGTTVSIQLPKRATLAA